MARTAIPRRRDGLVASLRVEPYPTGTVLPHERTHAGPKEGRLRLLRAARAQLEPIFLLYDGEPPVAVPDDREPDLTAGETRLWRVPGDGVADAFADRQLLIADGHHRYETALAYARRGGTPASARMMVVLVSTSDPGLEIFPTHRLFRGHEDALPPIGVGDSTTPATAVAQLATLPYDQAHAVGYRRGMTYPVVGEPGELDVELVDRLVGHEGLGYTPDLDEAIARVDAGEFDGSLPAACDAHRGRVRACPPRRGDAAEDDVLLPEADERPALPPGMSIDWLGALPRLRRGHRGDPRGAADAGRARAGPAGGNGRRRHDRDRRCGGGRRRCAAGSARRRLHARLGGARRARLRQRGPLRVVVDPIDGSVNAKRGIPFFSLSLAVAEGPAMGHVTFGFVHDFGAREEWVAERGGAGLLNGRPLTSPPPKDPIEILSFEATTTAYIAERAPRPPRRGGAASRDGIPGALALPSRGGQGGCRVLAQGGALDRHRCGPAARP